MSDYLKLVLLVLAALIVLYFLIDAWFKERSNVQMAKRVIQDPETKEPSFALEPSTSLHSSHNPIPSPSVMQSMPKKDEFIVINVIAKPGSFFSSYDLLQSISATGMQFGEMNIFHYYHDYGNGRQILFSLASATEPGEFDLNNIGDFNCAGLSLFMNLRTIDDPSAVFLLMLSIAEQLADDLNGDLLGGAHMPWGPEALSHYQHKIQQYAYPA